MRPKPPAFSSCHGESAPGRNSNGGTVLLLLRSLERGGAERQVTVLTAALRRGGERVTVLTFYSGGPLVEILQSEGVSVVSLGKKGRWDIVGFLVSLIRVLRANHPRVMYSFLTVPNVIALIASCFVPRARLIWGVRASDLDLSHYDWFARLTDRMESWLARYADAIIVNSYAGRAHAATRGFPVSRMVVVPNGIDTSYFAPDPAGRARVRAEWGVTDDVTVIGVAARVDPVKDHETFLRAAGRVADQCENARFVCVGQGTRELRESMRGLCAELGLESRVIWCGPRDDMPAVYSAIDIACSSSLSEGFSNTIAEAMACMRPCVVTDVGDSARIVGAAGVVVHPGEPNALAEGMLRVLSMTAAQRRALGKLARRRIEEEFSVETLASRTLAVINGLCTELRA